MQPIVKVTDADVRADLEAAIAALRLKQRRMPAAWVDRRAEVGAVIDDLVDAWLRASE